ncbi:MAG: hypothetical protein ABI665_21485 [Vicinamibacterales bacterium]
MNKAQRDQDVEARLISRISQYFEGLERRVFRPADLREIVNTNAADWMLPAKLSSSRQFLKFLLERTQLKEVVVRADEFERHFTRYTWGEVRAYELALTLGKTPYLSHASAAFVHGLTEQIPKTIYINDEQTPKNFPPSSLTQAAIDRAFAGKQRTSKAIWSAGSTKILIVSGKNTGRLEVGQAVAPDGYLADVTKIERTLIDITVRPDYAGGPYYVRDIYAAARDRISMNVLVATLKKINHAYPYHQVIGFYLKRVGYEPSKLEPLKRLGLHWDFYLTYGMKEKDFDPEWRLYFPKGF